MPSTSNIIHWVRWSLEDKNLGISGYDNDDNKDDYDEDIDEVRPYHGDDQFDWYLGSFEHHQFLNIFSPTSIIYWSPQADYTHMGFWSQHYLTNQEMHQLFSYIWIFCCCENGESFQLFSWNAYSVRRNWFFLFWDFELLSLIPWW